jgi:hypothetical protein
MSNILPEVIETEIAEEPKISMEIDENSNISNDDMDEEQEQDEEIPVEPKPKIDNKVIFQDAPQVKPVVKEKKKRVMSEKQLENLKKARDKSNKLRAERKAQREAEAQALIDANKDKYIKQKVEKAMKSEEKIIDKQPVLVSQSNISHEDIQSIISNSILEYDNKRKVEKAEKKKKKAQEQEKERINNTIRRAQGQPASLKPTEAGYFNNCF